MSDILGFADNLERRWTAHESEMTHVYYPVAAPALTDDEWKVLAAAAPEP